MATLVYNNRDERFELYHGNDTESYLQLFNYGYLGKIKIPSISEYNEETKDKFISAVDYFNTITNSENRFYYRSYNMEMKLISEINNISYYPVIIPININVNNIKRLVQPPLEKVLDLFDMTFSEYQFMVDFTTKKGYNKIIVKNNLKLYVSPYTDTFFTLFKGNPIEKYFEVDWKDRFNCDIPVKKIPNYYKKKIRSKYTGGTDGEIFISLYYRESWPNLFNYEPKIYEYDNFKKPEITDYDNPCCYSEEQLKYKKEQEELEKKRKEEALRQNMLNRLKDGYCDVCGAPNASYVIDPFDDEINGVKNHRWLCKDCYNDCLGDI